VRNEETQTPRNVYTFAGLIIGAPRISIPTRATSGGAAKDCFIPPRYKKRSNPARVPHPHTPSTLLATQICQKIDGKEE